MTIAEKLQSFRQVAAASYVKPPIDKLENYRKNLESHEPALDYLRKRGLARETISHFKLGYDPERDAIAIPVFKKGDLINIRYRLLDPGNKPKYTQEKGCEVWVYNDEGIERAQKKGNLLIVEGEFDLMAAWQAGFKSIISPASGKDSYAMWLDLIDSIPRVYIAYDNDTPGKTAAINMSERIGVEKCMEVSYPEGIKDANEFFLQKTKDDFQAILKDSRPFYRYTYQGLADIIDDIRTKRTDTMKINLVPLVEFEPDWVTIISGDSNIGKTTYSLNIANELANRGIPTLVMPYEDGVRAVGKRYLQVRHEKSKQGLTEVDDQQWEKIKEDSLDLPLYFSVPSTKEFADTIARAKRIFGVKVVIVDHLDYMVRKAGDNKAEEQAKTMMEITALAQEHKILFLVVHHIKKPEAGKALEKNRRPHKEDLKGSSSIYQDARVVVMLSEPSPGQVLVDVVKNKGEMGEKVFEFDTSTGRIKGQVNDFGVWG